MNLPIPAENPLVIRAIPPLAASIFQPLHETLLAKTSPHHLVGCRLFFS